MKKLLSILKTFGVIAGTIATVWAVFEMYDSIRDAQAEQTNKLVELNRKIDNVNVSIDSVFVLATENKQAIIEQDQQFMSLERSFKFYRGNVGKIDKEQMEQIIIDAYGLGLAEGKKKEMIP